MEKQQQVKISKGLARSISTALGEYQKILETNNRHRGVQGYKELLDQLIWEADRKEKKINSDYKVRL